MTGMREQEVIYATDKCSDFSNCTVSVKHNPEYGWTPKAYKERTIPVPKALMSKLKAMLVKRGKGGFQIHFERMMSSVAAKSLQLISFTPSPGPAHCLYLLVSHHRAYDLTGRMESVERFTSARGDAGIYLVIDDVELRAPTLSQCLRYPRSLLQRRASRAYQS